MTSKSLPALSLVLSLLVSAGCVAKPPGTAATSPPSRPISQISPVEFFPPEQKRLSQHLDWNTGCFKVEYAGPTAKIASRLELWNAGKPPDHNSNFSSMAAGMGEVSVSVRDDPGNSRNYRVVHILSSQGGHAGGSGSYTKPDLGSWSTVVAKIPGPVELRRGEEVVVWALMLKKSGSGEELSNRDGEPIIDRVKQSDWALVLKVILDPVER